MGESSVSLQMSDKLYSLSSFPLSLWERVGERACARQASHPPLTPPKGRGRHQARFNNFLRRSFSLSRRYDKLRLIETSNWERGARSDLINTVASARFANQH